MIRLRPGTVRRVLVRERGYLEIEVDCEGRHVRAIAYTDLLPEPEEGDTVALNTTAGHLGLGTGGKHFVLSVAGKETFNPPGMPDDCNDRGQGHIMKLRYTPLQLKVLSAEEEAHPSSERIRQCEDLNGMPVVACLLHSHLPAVLAGARAADPTSAITYLMTDGGALPLYLSDTVRALRECGWLNSTVTTGHSFGGDYEAINNYSGLLVAKVAAGAKLCVCGMGPGIVGTGSAFGFTGIEQGEVVNAVASLGGRPVVVPRISFSDQRDRHRGLSHHTLTVLTRITRARAMVVLPSLSTLGERGAWQEKALKEQVRENQLDHHHQVLWASEDDMEWVARALETVAKVGLNLTTMGRTLDEEREFFIAAVLAGLYGSRMVGGEEV